MTTDALTAKRGMQTADRPQPTDSKPERNQPEIRAIAERWARVNRDHQQGKQDTPYRKYLAKQPPNIVDTPEAVAARIGEYVSLGFDHFILRFNYGQEIEKMRLFTDKVRDKI